MKDKAPKVKQKIEYVKGDLLKKPRTSDTHDTSDDFLSDDFADLVLTNDLGYMIYLKNFKR